MRIQKWSAWVIGLMVIAFGNWPVSAQQPAQQYSAEYDQEQVDADLLTPPEAIFSPPDGASPAFHEQYTENPYEDNPYEGNPYDAIGNGPGAYHYQQGPYPLPEVPDQMQGFPAMSPYEPQFNQTNRNSGLWFNTQSNAGRVWFAEIDMWLTSGKSPNGGEQRNQVGFPIQLTADRGGGGAGAGGGAGGGGGAGAAQSTPGTYHYVRSLSTSDQFHSQGVVPYIGFTNVDGSGFELGGFYVANGNQGLFENERAFPVQINRGNSNTGNLDPNGAQYQPMTFDASFVGDASSRIYSLDTNALTTPILGSGKNRVRAMYGVRYYGLQENLNFTGQSIARGITFIESDVRSQLIGPQGGLKWDLGGKSFKLIGTGKLGALFDFDQVSVTGYNYEGLHSNSREKHLHIAPTLDLTIMGELPLFSYLPLINRIPVVRDGMFRVGYNYTALFFVKRPADSIKYDVNTPGVEIHHVTYAIQGTRLGISWAW